MGAQESRLAEDGQQDLKGIKGFHVLRVADSSPAAEAGIEPFFDYVVGVGGRGVSEDGEELTRQLEQAENRFVTLQIYSARRQDVRDLRVMPNRRWSSSGSSRAAHEQPSLLGLSLRLCSPEHALNNVWHILDIIEGSPAQDAGLVPFGDWVIGYAGGVLRGEQDLYRVIEAHEDRPLRLFVYNADYEVTREVVIVPNRSWGSGDGLLGCSIGFGFLHRIPKTVVAPSSGSSQHQHPHSHTLSDFDDHPPPTATHNGLPSYPASSTFQGGFSASAGVSLIPTSTDVLRSISTPPPPFAPSTAPAPSSTTSSSRPFSIPTDPTLGKGRPSAPPTSSASSLVGSISTSTLNRPPPTSPQRTVSPNSLRGPPVSPSGRSFPGRDRSTVAEVIREEDE